MPVHTIHLTFLYFKALNPKLKFSKALLSYRMCLQMPKGVLGMPINTSVLDRAEQISAYLKPKCHKNPKKGLFYTALLKE